MDGLTIFWTQTAIKQRNHIFDYWNNRNKSDAYSQKLNLTIRERVELLKSQPEMGKKTNFANTRAIIMGHYSILYKIDKPRINNRILGQQARPQKTSPIFKKSL